MENWRPIEQFEGLYEVSDLGRVRSLDRFVMSRHGLPNRPVAGAQKTFSKNSQGYLSAHLYRDGKCTAQYVHRLVAGHFLDNTQNLPQVNHRDGEKTNNAASNLEWCTARANCQHAVDESLYNNAKGQQVASAKLTDDDVRKIRSLALSGAMHKEIAALFPVGRKAITKIVNRQRWKHV